MNKVIENFRKIVNCKKGGKDFNWLIVMPKITMIDDQQYVFPVGIAYVSSALKATGRNVFTLNLNYKARSTYDLLNDVIKQNNIDIVATGGITGQFALVKSIVDMAKEIKPEVITVTGGGLITSDPESAMKALETVDYGVIGEGEITICELAYAFEMGLNISEVDGIIYKNESGLVSTTSTRDDIADLDAIPWPDYDGFEYEQMLSKTPIDLLSKQTSSDRVGIILNSRSCPYNCTFCFHSSGKKYRARSLDSFFDELDYVIRKYSINNFYLMDEYFIRSVKFINEFCERIKTYGLSWSCTGRVDNITREMVETLKDAGCYNIRLGVESANDNILESMRKHISRAQIENAFSICQEVGIDAGGHIIFGDLEETVETAMDTINWWKDHQDWVLTMGWISVYPGSYVYKICCERGLIADPVQYIKAGCPQFNFSKMTDDERKQIATAIETLTNEKHDILNDAFLIQGQSGKVTLTGNCPYCGERGKFLNLDPVRPQKSELCAGCNRALRLFSLDYMIVETVDSNVRRLLQSHNIALWPVVQGVRVLIERIPTLQNDDVIIIDSSSVKQGALLANKIIHPPDAIHSHNIDTVLITMTGATAGMDIMSNIQKNYPQVKRVELIGDLFFPSFASTDNLIREPDI